MGILDNTKSDKNNGKEEEQKEEIKRKISFKVKDFKLKHYDGKDLITLVMIEEKEALDDEEYEIQILIGGYGSYLYPEFKEIDKWDSNKSFEGFKDFVKTLHYKIKYFSEMHSKKLMKDKGINSWDPYQEWWQENEIQDKINSEITKWISNNEEYLVQYNFDSWESESTTNLIEYLKNRNDMIKPKFNDYTDLDEQKQDIYSLEHMLNEAIKKEEYEEAINIREKIKQLK